MCSFVLSSSPYNVLNVIAHSNFNYFEDWNPEWDRAAEDLTWERVCFLFCKISSKGYLFFILSIKTTMNTHTLLLSYVCKAVMNAALANS